MPTKTKKAPVAKPEIEETESGETPEKSPEETEVDSIDVIHGDIFVRQYSRELHGDDFEALAEQFVGKMNGKKHAGVDYAVSPSSKIGLVEVRYREKEDAELHIDKQKPDSPMVDKVQQFEDKEAALKFGRTKFGSTVVISKKRLKKE